MATLFSSPASVLHPLPVDRTRGSRITLWGAQIALAGMVLLAGGLKLAGVPVIGALFEAIGAGQWVRYVTRTIVGISAAAPLAPSPSALGVLLVGHTVAGRMP